MAEVDDMVAVLERVSIEMTTELLRASGGVAPPTVHMLDDRLPQPYIGSVATRPFYRGEDAAQAVTALGILPSTVRATRILVVWEYADLLVALEDPRPTMPEGLVVVDATLAEHVVRWHGCEFRMPGQHDDPAAVVVPRWGRTARHPGGALPAPVDELLEVWRELHGGDVTAVRAQLEEMGFVVSWAADRQSTAH